MKLSDIIKQYRDEDGISQREFARRCGLSNSSISILEMGVNPQTGKPMDPDMRTYRRLAAGMGITVSTLFSKMRSGNSSPISDEDQARLEALHQNPQLGLLFDRSRKMTHDDVEFMLQMADRILKERDGD